MRVAQIFAIFGLAAQAFANVADVAAAEVAEGCEPSHHHCTSTVTCVETVCETARHTVTVTPHCPPQHQHQHHHHCPPQHQSQHCHPHHHHHHCPPHHHHHHNAAVGRFIPENSMVGLAAACIGGVLFL